jgi:hypothetical protein
VESVWKPFSIEKGIEESAKVKKVCNVAAGGFALPLMCTKGSVYQRIITKIRRYFSSL